MTSPQSTSPSLTYALFHLCSSFLSSANWAFISHIQSMNMRERHSSSVRGRNWRWLYLWSVQWISSTRNKEEWQYYSTNRADLNRADELTHTGHGKVWEIVIICIGFLFFVMYALWLLISSYFSALLSDPMSIRICFPNKNRCDFDAVTLCWESRKLLWSLNPCTVCTALIYSIIWSYWA